MISSRHFLKQLRVQKTEHRADYPRRNEVKIRTSEYLALVSSSPVYTIAMVNWELARANFLSCVSRPHLRSLRVSRRLNPKMVEELSREEQEMGRVDSVLS